MIPEEDDMIALCRKLDDIGQQVEWGSEPPVLLLISLVRKADAYMVSPFGTQPVMLADGAGEGLAIIVEGFEMGVGAAKDIDPMLADTLAAIAYVFEIEYPNGRQARMVMACDCGGRFYQIIRFRGSGTEEAFTSPGGTIRFQGAIPSLLIRLVKVLLSAAPGDSGNREALDELLRKVGFGG